MTPLLLGFEGRIAAGALRRVIRHPSRRALWFVTGALAAAAVAFDIATSGVATRNLGTWSPSPVLVAAIAAAILVVAALAGSRTPLTYGTRAADTVWWHYAGIDSGAGQRATTAILTVRATLLIALGAVPVGGLLAYAAPQRAWTLVALTAVVVVLTPVTVIVASLCAPRADSAVADAVRSGADPASADDGAAPAGRASRTDVPRGIAAARWLAAVRRREMLVPFDRFAVGLVLGFVAPRAAAIVAPEAIALAVIIGPLSLVLDASIRGTTAPATLRSPWWRAAIGTSPLALAAWAWSDAAGIVLLLGGGALGLGIALGAPLPALAAIPALVLLPVALRLVVLAVDTFYPATADRYGPGASARLLVVWQLTGATVALALFAGSRGGGYASIAATTVALLAIAAAAAWCSAARLSTAVEV